MARRSDSSYAPPSLDWDSERNPQRLWRRLRTWDTMPGFHTLPKGDRRVQYYHDATEFREEPPFSGARITTLSTGTSSFLSGYEPGVRFHTFGSANSAARSYIAGTDFGALSQEALVEMKLDLANKVGDMKTHLGVVIAEARKTADMIESACSRVLLAYRSFRRGKFKDVAEILNLKPRTVHKTWLEYRYGWMPFLRDVEGQAELLAQQCGLGGRSPRFTVKSRKVKLNKLYSTVTHFVPWGGGGMTGTRTVMLVAEQTMYLKAKIELANSHLAALQQTGVTNPALLAWEVIPYSFVIDWFISVGSYCQALTAFTGANVIDKMLSSEVKYIYTDEIGATTVQTADHIYDNGRYFVLMNIRDYLRDPDISLNVSMSELTVKNPFPDWKKMLSSLALTRTQTSRLESQPTYRKIRI